MSEKVETPKWDEALSNMVNEAYAKQGHSLSLGDFSDLADEYSFRLDDIMVTIFQLVISGDWKYVDGSGNEQQYQQPSMSHH